MKNKRGITLIALVVTIIVLLILSGVALSLILGGDGILNKAETSTEQYRIAAARELLDLKIAEINSDSYEQNLRKASFEEIVKKLKDDNELEFVVVGPPTAMLKAGISISDEELDSLEYILVSSREYEDITFEIKKVENDIKIAYVETNKDETTKEDDEGSMKIPTATIEISENGEYDVTNYATANVNVPGLTPTGTKQITEKANNIDVAKYQYADTTGMYTADEYNSYGTTKYNEGYAANKSLSSGAVYKTGTIPNNTYQTSILLGFNPTFFVIKFNTDGSGYLGYKMRK